MAKKVNKVLKMSSDQVIKRETDQSPAENIDPVDEQDEVRPCSSSSQSILGVKSGPKQQLMIWKIGIQLFNFKSILILPFY